VIHANVRVGADVGDVARERDAIADRDVTKELTTERTPALDPGALRFGAVVTLDGTFGAQTDHAERQPVERGVVEVIEAERFHEAGVAQGRDEKIHEIDDDRGCNGSSRRVL